MHGAYHIADGACGALYEENILDELPELTNEWVEAALRETDDPREGDYIRYQYGGYESVSRYEAENDYAFSENYA